MRNDTGEGKALRLRTDRSYGSHPTGGSGTAPGARELRLGAKGLVTSPSQDLVLLVQEPHLDGSTFWTIPGGGLQASESLSECLRRECEEEIGCAVTVGEMVGSYAYAHTSRPVTTFYAVFDTTLADAPEPNEDEQIIDHAWRKPGNLPATTLAPVAGLITEMTDTGSE